MTGADVARAAEALVGAPFRLHGRDPATGLDCVGVVAAALAAAGRPVSAPPSYGLRNRSVGALLAQTETDGLIIAIGATQPGDIVLVCPGPAQHHLLVAAPGNRFIHAHAGLRRVVAQPGPLAWPTMRRWRLADEDT